MSYTFHSLFILAVLIIVGTFTARAKVLTQTAKLLASDGQEFDHFGGSVSLSDDIALIGADDDDDNGNCSGSVYIFTRTLFGTWTQTAKLVPNDNEKGDGFGSSVSLDGDIALTGAPFDGAGSA